MDRAFRKSNNYHIPEYINEKASFRDKDYHNDPKLKTGDAWPEGESAAYYNKIRELLDRK